MVNGEITLPCAVLGEVTFKSIFSRYITLLSVTWVGLAYLFLITKTPKVIFLATVMALSHQK